MAKDNREIWAADCETDPFRAGRIPRPFVWGVSNGSEYHQFTKTREFVEFITARECVVYAHNGGKFDWHFILEYMEEFEEVMIIAGRLAKFKIGNAEFRDSYNILPIPLGAYKKDDMNYEIMEEEERYKPENWKKISEYLRGDCVYLHELITEFFERYGRHLTLAGAAMRTWEKMADIKAPKTSAGFYETFAPYYYGGRVECFRAGTFECDFSVIDINSAYPFAMTTGHPYGDAFIVVDEIPEDDTEAGRCFIHLRAESHGAFPVREKTGLSFPADGEIREFHISGWEYLAARDTGALKNAEVLSVIEFCDTIEFTGYVDHFFEMKDTAKEAGDTAGYIFSKLFLNSLYGKFAANPEQYHEYTVIEPDMIDAAKKDGWRFSAELGPWALMWQPLQEEKQRYYNVAVAASITGFVRAYLFRALSQCTGLIYCDTDSIAAETFDGLDLDPSRLGAWDVEAVCDRGGVAGKKLYAFHGKDGKWKTASKGVRLGHDEIMKVAGGENVTYTPENPSFSVKRGVRFISREVARNV